MPYTRRRTWPDTDCAGRKSSSATLSRDRKHTARLINRFGDQATVRRIEPESA
jgi:hypothetical protein